MSVELDRLAERLRADLPAGESGADAVLARRRLVEAATAPASRTRGTLTAVAVAASLVAGVAALILVLAGRTADPLEFTAGVHALSGRTGQYYASNEGSEFPLRFSDGSEVKVLDDGALRVTDLGARTTTVQVETGRAEFRIVHRSGSEWRILAGPYTVRVTGTAFVIDWNGPERTLDLRMHSGSVVVTGPGIENGHTVSGSERFVTRVMIGERAEPSVDSPPRTPQPEPSMKPPNATETSPVDRASAALSPSVDAPSSPAVQSDWPRLVARGAYREVVEAAEREGLDGILSRASAAELKALADAARLTGRTALAARTLVALRARFPASSAASEAAFILGRMADDGGKRSEALRWYDTHLAEGGAFAPEALGRKMLALHAAGETTLARSVATEYLARFPAGPYARQAKDLAER